jgi:hypothetical protein
MQFTSYKQWLDYIEFKLLKHGKDFYTTEEYRQLYPVGAALRHEELKALAERGQVEMKNAGVWFGDKVFYDVLSPWGIVEPISGKIVSKKGVPYVKLDEGQKSGSGKRHIRWHKGFRKA